MAHRLLTQRGGGSMFRILSRPFSNKTIDFETETSEISKLRSFLNNNVKTKGLGETQMNIVMAMETPPQTTTPVHFAMLMDGHNIEIDGDTPAYVLPSVYYDRVEVAYGDIDFCAERVRRKQKGPCVVFKYNRTFEIKRNIHPEEIVKILEGISGYRCAKKIGEFLQKEGYDDPVINDLISITEAQVADPQKTQELINKYHIFDGKYNN
eukprot:294033_1